jgi:predicted negative regulator of RcsB-dependent stress response
MNLFDV